MSKIHFIGVGTMGARMVRNIAGKGHELRISDANQDVAQQLATELDAEFVPQPAAFDDHEIVILMLPNSSVVSAVLGEPNDPSSLMRALPSGAVVIDMSSSSPDATVENHKVLSSLGVHYVDAPVSGGPSKAATGELTIMVGTETAEIFGAVEPILKNMGTNVIRSGGVGAGHALKALNNLLAVIGIVGSLEVLAVGKKFGLEPQLMLDVINKSTGRNHATEVKIAQQVLSRDWNVGFSLALTVKDVNTALELAASQGVVSPVSQAAAETARLALELLKEGTPDQSQIAEFIEQTNSFTFDGKV